MTSVWALRMLAGLSAEPGQWLAALNLGGLCALAGYRLLCLQIRSSLRGHLLFGGLTCAGWALFALIVVASANTASADGTQQARVVIYGGAAFLCILSVRIVRLLWARLRERRRRQDDEDRRDSARRGSGHGERDD